MQRRIRLKLFLSAIITTILLQATPLAGAAESKPGWEAEWKRTLESAKKEGTVVVTGSPDPVMRNEIVPKFTARFGIPVQYIAGGASQIVARLSTERNAKLYSTDIFMAGMNTVANILYPNKMLDPLKPILILPEVVEPSKWRKGKLWFQDPEERHVLRVFSSIANLFHINRDHVKPAELRASKDLLNPKWRGKISAEDPILGGGGANKAARFYVQLGEEFVRKLYKEQKLVFSRERRQMADWVARGTYPICLDCRDDDLKSLQQEGFNFFEFFELTDMPGTLTSAPWLLTLLNQAPHPNAARVFANWIVSKEALEIYSRAFGYATLRTDADESFLKSETIPRPEVKYFDDADWQWAVTGRAETRKRVENILKAP
jgi:ABC-type Fe3+ transport system substrate-binding protein